MASGIYDQDLDRNPANFQPLTPLTFLERAADVHPDRVAIIHGRMRETYAELRARAHRLGSALATRGIERGDTVAVMLANTPAMIECHYGVPMCGAVLNTLNTRLDAATIAFILDHGEAKVLITDREFSALIAEGAGAGQGQAARHRLRRPGSAADRRAPRRDRLRGAASATAIRPTSGWPRSTSGTPSRSTTRRAPPRNPKGVVYHHRGAHLLALGNVRDRRDGQARGLSLDAADVPLQRLVLPLVGVGGGRHACLPAPGPRRRHLRCDRRARRHPYVRRADRDVDHPRRDGGREAAGAQRRSPSSPPPRRRPKRCSPR